MSSPCNFTYSPEISGKSVHKQKKKFLCYMIPLRRKNVRTASNMYETITKLLNMLCCIEIYAINSAGHPTFFDSGLRL